jgi:glycosyltransferase involved in cell wall biosynthesis
VAIFTRPIDQGVSGSGHHLAEIVSHALDANDGRFTFTLVHYQRNDLPIYRRAEELIVPRNPFAAARILRARRFDVVHYAPLSPYAPIWGVRAAKIATVHGAEPYLVPELYSRAHRFHAAVTKPWMARRMDALVTVSQTSRSFLSSRFGIPAERFVVCHNGVGPAYRRLPREEVSAPARCGIRGPYLLHMSNFSERKNPGTIFRGYAELYGSPEGRDLTLVIAGNRWKNPRTLALAAELGITDRVVYTGFVSERDSVELLNGAACFFFPSLAEGFGMPNLEAMACGCPVVTSGVFAIPEIVADAAIMLEDPRDWKAAAERLRDVLRDGELRRGLIERGMRRAAAFTWTESARTLLGLYERLGAGRG